MKGGVYHVQNIRNISFCGNRQGVHQLEKLDVHHQLDNLLNVYLAVFRSRGRTEPTSRDMFFLLGLRSTSISGAELFFFGSVGGY